MIKNEDFPIIAFDTYQQRANSFAIYPSVGSNMTYPALGLAGEVGELCNKIKKITRDHNDVLTDNMRYKLIDELGDVLWYVAALANELDVNLESVALLNLTKLEGRKLRNKIHGSGDDR